MSKYSDHACLVSDIPWFLKPFSFIISHLLALIHVSYFLLVLKTSKVKIVGKEHIQDDPSYVFAVWHTHVVASFILLPLLEKRQVWLQHPLWYM